MEKIRLKINGREIEATPGKTILEVVQENQLDDIPTLCHSPELEPYGSCFVCVVEVKGRNNLVPSCATRVAPGMEVETRNDRITASRKTALELLTSNHYADCVSPCMEGCPAGVDAQGYIALSAMGQYRKAVDLIRETNPLPAVCGRVCVRKCEEECRRQDIDASVAINNIKRFLTDSPDAYATEPECEPDTGKTVGIIGSGPAGLTAAWFLGKSGIKPVIYEAKERTGGMLRYGIPEYRLPDDVLDREVEYICRAGAEIRCGVRVGADISLDELRQRHDAVFVGPGAWTGKPMRVEGEYDTEGVVTGADFLVEKADNPEPLSGTVVVVGGGNTAMDAARTSWRLNADKVIVLYRRTKAQMPADAMEIEDCLEEGIEIMELAAPTGIVKKDGKLAALQCQRMKLGEPDASGRRRPVPIEGAEFELPCDLVISAIGQDTVLEGLLEAGNLELDLTRWNTYVIDGKTMKTNVEGVFAGGDAADDGPTVAIDAIRDGRKAAGAIRAWLLGEDLPAKPFAVRKEFWSKPGHAELGDIMESPRHEVHLIDVDERRNSFREVSNGFEPEDNVHECDRCLSCGCVRFDDCRLRLYAEEYGVDMEHFKGYARKHRVDDRHPYISYDPNKCILCARCIRTCARVLPVSALGLVNRGFRTEMRPAMNDPLVATSCVSCGNCVDSCPTAALTVKFPFPGRACLDSEDVKTHCAFCSLGCEVTVSTFGEGRYYIKSSGEPGDYLCRYGRFGQELFIKQERYSGPVKKEGYSYRPVSFKIAYSGIVEGLRRIADDHGPESVAVFVSPELTNEELNLAGRIAREGIGTSNIGSLAILSGAGRSGVLDEAFGFTASTSDRKCLREADLIVCNNTSLESDHLILAVDVIEAVRDGAKLVVSNSILDSTDEHMAALAVDPMRGRASIFWNAVMQVLIDDGDVNPMNLKGGEEFLRDRSASIELAAAKAGVGVSDIYETAELLRFSGNVVFIHSPDRAQDASPDDMEIFADLTLLLRDAGKTADILLPRLLANSAGLEVMGADPAFMTGRKPSGKELPGAASSQELRLLLEDGKLRGALIIGENPLEYNRPGSWFRNTEFIAAMDWTDTETTRFADYILPGTTYLETPGTRCNFEGRLLEFTGAVMPPSGKSGTDVLQGLASAFGIDASVDDLDARVLENLGDLARIYWNTGQERHWDGSGRLVPVSAEARAASIQPPLTHSQEYRQEIRQVGTERYRVI
ncbi:MAG: FAD-dependent oxidoreductase [Candidatus Fermentibacteraceae bacterium]|nr:FAD-dependent oxidoreductase [Candidatus Fermentibacteraceae bacterium]MBN2608411.1 FAD-dependent oxidoreductase [Candidatus Fermentibacteraceae bacterium]